MTEFKSLADWQEEIERRTGIDVAEQEIYPHDYAPPFRTAPRFRKILARLISYEDGRIIIIVAPRKKRGKNLL